MRIYILFVCLLGCLVRCIPTDYVSIEEGRPDNVPCLWIVPILPNTVTSSEQVVGDTTTRTWVFMNCLTRRARSILRVGSRGLRCLWADGKRKLSPYAMSSCSDHPTAGSVRKNWFVFLLLLISGNIHPNPGPDLVQLQTPDEFKNSDGLRFFHLNVRSLINKIDLIRVWAESTNSDIIVLSETWLNKSSSNSMIHIVGYNVYRSDRTKKGGGIAIYFKSTLNHLYSF